MKTHFVVRISTYIDAVDYDEKARREMIHREVIQAVSFNAAKRQATKIFEEQPIHQTIKDAWARLVSGAMIITAPLKILGIGRNKRPVVKL